MSETIALRQPSIWAAVRVISSTIASLPLLTYMRDSNGESKQVPSFLDNPAPMGLPRFNWMELVMLQLLLNGEIGFIKIKNNAGATIQLMPCHYANYQVNWNGENKVYKVLMNNGTTETYTDDDFLQLLGPSLDGLRGMSPLNLFRRTIQLTTALQTAATRSMTNGAHVSGFITPTEAITEDDAKIIQAGLAERVEGPEQAGKIAVLNRPLQFTSSQINNVDLQFLESRQFEVHEVARMFNIPAQLLHSNSKEQSFASGLQEQMREFQQMTLVGWTARLEAAFTQLLPSQRYARFDFHDLLSGSPSEQINTLIAQTGKPFMTVNEARKILDMDPIEGGDVLAAVAAPIPPQASPAQDVIQKHSALPAKTFTKKITKIKKGSNGELITTTEEE